MKLEKAKQQKLIMKVCHRCGHCHESTVELQACTYCGKAFLPVNYFQKIHTLKKGPYSTLFALGDELDEEDLIKGLYVLW